MVVNKSLLLSHGQYDETHKTHTMTSLTTGQITSLEVMINELLLQNPDLDAFERENCTEVSVDLVANWIEQNNIQVIAED